MGLVPAHNLSIKKSSKTNHTITFVPENNLIAQPWLIRFTNDGVEVNREANAYKNYTSKDFSDRFKQVIESMKSKEWESEVSFLLNGKEFMNYNVEENIFKFNTQNFPQILNNSNSFTYWVINYIENR